MMQRVQKSRQNLTVEVKSVLEGFGQLSSGEKKSYYLGLFDDLLHLMEFMSTGVCTWADRPRQVREGPHFAVLALKEDTGKVLGTSQIQVLNVGVNETTKKSAKGMRILALTGINLYQGEIPIDRREAVLGIIEAGYQLAQKSNMIAVIPQSENIHSNYDFEKAIIQELVAQGVLKPVRLDESVYLGSYGSDRHYNYQDVYLIDWSKQPSRLKETHLDEILAAGEVAKTDKPDEGETAESSSSSVQKEYGGINFDQRNLNLQIKRDGQGVPLPLLQQDLENIHLNGLYPIIINIQPMTAVLPILGFKEDEKRSEPLASN